MKKNTEKTFWQKVKKTDSCWLWQGCCDNDGYGIFQINGIRWKTHRYSYNLHYGNLNDLCVCHTCDVRNCVNPNHLWLGTSQQNTLDRDSKGRHRTNPTIGIHNGSSKFKEEQIDFIRNSNLSGQELSRMFNVSDATIYSIRNRKTWKHI